MTRGLLTPLSLPADPERGHAELPNTCGSDDNDEGAILDCPELSQGSKEESGIFTVAQTDSRVGDK